MTTVEVPMTQLEQFEPIIRAGIANFVSGGGKIIFHSFTFPEDVYDNECKCRCPLAACSVFEATDKVEEPDFEAVFMRTIQSDFGEDNVSAFVTGFDLGEPPTDGFPFPDQISFYEFGKTLHHELSPIDSNKLELEEWRKMEHSEAEDEDDGSGECPY